MTQDEIVAALATGEIRNFGPDLNILDYVFNPLDDSGCRNESIEELNVFNTMVYDRFHVPVSETTGRKLPVPIEAFPQYFLTKTTFHRNTYGGTFIDNFLHRIFAGATAGRSDEVGHVVCLRSVVMDPFMPYAQNWDFFRTIFAHIDETLIKLVQDWRMSQR